MVAKKQNTGAAGFGDLVGWETKLVCKILRQAEPEGQHVQEKRSTLGWLKISGPFSLRHLLIHKLLLPE